ncbi:hypothetical protein E5288_WYG018858 [Bos mutus]|uniref:Uncharacterized protein n=1 Tax=Bos mutus TaxID=72004 RepID=A0A6B0R5R7_9CETA|nr:hypothetical protein [Bos mutus]
MTTWKRHHWAGATLAPPPELQFQRPHQRTQGRHSDEGMEPNLKQPCPPPLSAGPIRGAVNPRLIKHKIDMVKIATLQKHRNTGLTQLRGHRSAASDPSNGLQKPERVSAQSYTN